MLKILTLLPDVSSTSLCLMLLLPLLLVYLIINATIIQAKNSGQAINISSICCIICLVLSGRNFSFFKIYVP